MNEQYQNFLACMFCFPNSDHVKFSRKFAFCLFIDYAYIDTWMHVHTTKFERNSSLGVPSRGLRWENKTCTLKRSIQLLDEPEYHVRNYGDRGM